MAEMMRLQPGETMPEDEDGALIERAGTEKYHVRGSAAFEGGATFPTVGPFDTFDEALASALWWADSMQTPTVYVSADCA